METLTTELNYEDEPMDVESSNPMDYCEEGEIYSSEDEKNEDVPVNTSSIFSENQPTGFVSSCNVFMEDEAQKKLERAKRFCIPPSDDREEFSTLYRELGIDKENERHYRFNTLHMRGTENMSTDDVLEYFVSHGPSHVEWINDVSCNVVWWDDVSAAKALISVSKKIKNLDKVHLHANPFEKDFKSDSVTETCSDLNDDCDDAVDAKDIKVAIPPGLWRIGVPSNQNSCILLRFATRSDKKQRHSEKKSEYYKKYGNPHYGYIPGLISSSRRNEMRKLKNKLSDPNLIKKDSEKNNPWEELAYEWREIEEEESTNQKYDRHKIVRTGPKIRDLRISLTNKKERARRIKNNLNLISDYTDKIEWKNKIKYPRMKMYADDEEKRLEKTSRKTTSTQPLEKYEEDLRSKISRKKLKIRSKFTSEKNLSSDKSSNSDNEYDDEKTSNYTLENYQDLRMSLEQNKRKQNIRYNTVQYDSDSKDDDLVDEMHDIYINQRSPLQIEIENDEYLSNKHL